MTRTIGEGQKVVEAVNKYGRIFRLDTWFRFKDTFYGLGTTVEPLKKLVQSGLLGWPLTVRYLRSHGLYLEILLDRKGKSCASACSG